MSVDIYKTTRKILMPVGKTLRVCPELREVFRRVPKALPVSHDVCAGNHSYLRRFLENDIPACLSSGPSSALRQQLHSRAMRLLTRLEYEPESCASWYTIFRQSPKLSARVYTYEQEQMNLCHQPNQKLQSCRPTGPGLIDDRD